MNGVYTPGRSGSATSHPAKRHSTAPNQTVTLNGFTGVLGTGGIKPTSCPKAKKAVERSRERENKPTNRSTNLIHDCGVPWTKTPETGARSPGASKSTNSG